MKNSNYTVQVIEPNEGMWLTQKDTPKEIKDISFCKKIYLAVNDSQDNYKEVTDEYKQEIEKQIEEARKAERK